MEQDPHSIMKEIAELELRLADLRQQAITALFADKTLSQNFVKIDWAKLKKELA